MIMTDRDGNMVRHYGYTAFGSQQYKHNTNAFDVTNRYTGRQFDDDTGLYFYQSRYYDPQLARFTQADSIVPSANTSQALNRYAYAANNPLLFIDQTGHFNIGYNTVPGDTPYMFPAGWQPSNPVPS